MANTLDTLKNAGVDVDQIPDEQRKILSELSDEEARVLASIQQRLNAASGDVAGFMADRGGIFW